MQDFERWRRGLPPISIPFPFPVRPSPEPRRPPPSPAPPAAAAPPPAPTRLAVLRLPRLREEFERNCGARADEVLRAASAASGRVDIHLTLAVLLQETHCRPQPRPNAAQAIGLMQVLPGTGQDMVGSRDFGFLNRTDNNVLAGSRYLAWLHGFFRLSGGLADVSRVGEEELTMVLAGYNWGPGNARNWRARMEREGRRIVWWNIPRQPGNVSGNPDETRHYVRDILVRLGRPPGGP